MILVATLGGPTMFARIGIMRALNRGHVREFDSTRKDHHWGKAEAETRYVMNDEKDAFDLWWEWADKPVDNKPTIDAAVYDAVMALPPDERRDRAKVNEAVRKAGVDLEKEPLHSSLSPNCQGACSSERRRSRGSTDGRERWPWSRSNRERRRSTQRLRRAILRYRK